MKRLLWACLVLLWTSPVLAQQPTPPATSAPPASPEVELPVPTATPLSAQDWYRAQLQQFPQRADLQLGLGRLLLAQGELSEARAALEQALRLAPEAHETRQVLAQVALQQAQPQQALDYLNTFLAHHPADPAGHLLRAEALSALGQPQQALAALERVLSLQPDHAEAQARRSALRSAHPHLRPPQPGARPHSVQALREWLPQVPADQTAYQLLIDQLEQQGHYAEARPWRAQLHQLNACAPENAWRLGRTLFWQGYPEQAEALLKQQLRCAPTAPAYLLLGQLAARRHDWEQASRFYQQGLAQFPDQPELLSAQALSLERQGQPEQARALLTRLKSPGPDGLRLRARLSLQAGEPQAALRDLQQLRHLGAHPDDQQELLLLYVQLGRAREAEAELQALLARAPERRVALELLAALIRQLPRRGRPDAPQASAERRWRR